MRLEESEAEVKVSIVLADDHRVVREGLRMLLEVKGGATVVAEAGDVVGARRALREHNPDVLVLDVNMPGESGLSALSRLREEFPETAIVVLTMQADPQLAREALREGARAYVLKEGARALLLEAVKAATAGRTYLDPLLGRPARGEAGRPRTARGRLDRA
ncbi:MAG: response regulator transcription factor [Actinomycetota bacterium]|nr:response regulator transcription factor [Actinomycetota bacterium]